MKTPQGSAMTTSWDLLKTKGGSLAGLIFRGCGLQLNAFAQTAPARLPVTVRGKRIKTVDVHAHCYFQEALDIAGVKVEKVVPPVKGIPEHFIAGNAIEKRLADMDAMAIDMEILSINPLLVSLRARQGRGDLQDQQRKACRVVRAEPGPLRRLRIAADAIPRSRGDDA